MPADAERPAETLDAVWPEVMRLRSEGLHFNLGNYGDSSRWEASFEMGPWADGVAARFGFGLEDTPAAAIREAIADLERNGRA